MRRSLFTTLVHHVPARAPLGWVVAATFFHFASFYYLFTTLPLYVLALGGSTLQVGLLNGVFSLTSLVVRPLFGAWMDRVGRTGFLLAGGGIYVLAALGYLVITSVPGLLLWRAFHALGLATFSTAAASLAGDFSPASRRGRTMGIYGLAQAAALSLGPGVGVAIKGVAGHYGVFLSAALTALVAVGCALVVAARHRDAGERSSPPMERRKESRIQLAKAPTLFQFAASIAYGSIVSFIAVAAEHRGLGAAGVFFGFLALSSLSVRLAAGRAYDTWGMVATLTPSFLVLALGMVVLALAESAMLFLASAILAGAGIGATHTTLLAAVIDRSPPQKRGRAVAVFTSCWELGVGGGSILLGYVAEAISFRGMYLVVSALPLVGVAAVRHLRRR